jgi:probable HAF family extracellular repeat protein
MNEHWVDALARATGSITNRRRGLRLIASAIAAVISLRVGRTTEAQSDCGGLFQPECLDPTECQWGDQVCNGTCVDVSQNDEHCGLCGRRCWIGESCINGSCEATGYEQDNCPIGAPDLCGTICTNLLHDEKNCGECGVVCSGDSGCRSGRCDCGGIIGAPDPCGDQCVNFLHDRENCGGCGIACPVDMQCRNGECACSGFDQTDACDGQCTNVSSDPENCGGCGIRCETGSHCSNGTCSRLEQGSEPSAADQNEPAAGRSPGAYEVVLLGQEGWAGSIAGDVSEDGRVVGGWWTAGGDSTKDLRVVLWDGEAVVDLAALGMVYPAQFNHAGAVTGFGANGDPIVYRPETETIESELSENLPKIEPPAGFAEAQVNAVNQSGEAVGALYPVSADDADGARGFVTSASEIIVLEPAPGGDTSIAWWINDAGQVVGGPARDENDGLIFDGRAFLYDLRSGATTDLGTLPAFDGSFPWGINNAGQVVGEAWLWRSNDTLLSHAFLYDPNMAEMFDFNSLIPAGTGWVLIAASDINDAGQIVGYGMVEGSVQAFLLNPKPSSQGS